MDTNYKHQLAEDVSEAWEYHGHKGWRPSMAYPFFVGFGLRKAKCGCGRVFRKLDDFYAHYLYHAIWLFESSVLPTEWRNLKAVSGLVSTKQLTSMDNAKKPKTPPKEELI